MLAICERMPAKQKGQVVIYDIDAKKKKKKLPETMEQSKQYQSNEMLNSAFNPRDERIIITLTG